jgi:hypothetical protein
MVAVPSAILILGLSLSNVPSPASSGSGERPGEESAAAACRLDPSNGGFIASPHGHTPSVTHRTRWTGRTKVVLKTTRFAPFLPPEGHAIPVMLRRTVLPHAVSHPLRC